MSVSTRVLCSESVAGTLGGLTTHLNVTSLGPYFRNFTIWLSVFKNQKLIMSQAGSFLRSFGGSFLNKCVYLKSNGASGGIITGWSSRFFNCQEVLVRKIVITVLLSSVTRNTNFYVTNVYGPASWDGKEEFFSEVAHMKDRSEGKWIIYGDFNSTRGQEEQRGRPWSSKATALFNDLINELALIDLPLTNQSFTWSNMQKTPTLAKLDRFLISTE